MSKYKVGDKVRVSQEDHYRLVVGDAGMVVSVGGSGIFPISIVVKGSKYCMTEEGIELTKPKAEKVTVGDVNVGDLIVCFWDFGADSKMRKKGVVWSKNATTLYDAKGRFLSYSDELEEDAEHIYIVKRAEKPKTYPELWERVKELEKELECLRNV